MHNTFQILNKWFKANFISLNYEKTQCVSFRTKYPMQIDTKIIYGNNIISNVLGLVTDKTLSWSTHAEGKVNK